MWSLMNRLHKTVALSSLVTTCRSKLEYFEVFLSEKLKQSLRFLIQECRLLPTALLPATFLSVMCRSKWYHPSPMLCPRYYKFLHFIVSKIISGFLILVNIVKLLTLSALGVLKICTSTIPNFLLFFGYVFLICLHSIIKHHQHITLLFFHEWIPRFSEFQMVFSFQ